MPDMVTMAAATAMSSLCWVVFGAPSVIRLLAPSKAKNRGTFRQVSCAVELPDSVGPSQLCCQTGQKYLTSRVVQRIGKVRRSSTMAQASSALKQETKDSSDDSLEAAVKAIEFTGVHHVGMLCESVERSLTFYCGLLGLEVNPDRPSDKLSFGGVWLNVGSSSQMIHLMELPNPDPTEGRPENGGRDRHACVSVKDVTKIKEVFDKAGVPYTFSESGRPAVFARDPDGNALEFSQL